MICVTKQTVTVQLTSLNRCVTKQDCHCAADTLFSDTCHKICLVVTMGVARLSRLVGTKPEVAIM